MMRTIEVIIAIAILIGGVAGLTAYLSVPPPQTISSAQLTQLGYSLLQRMTASGVLQQAAFNPNNPIFVGQLESAFLASLPSNVVYNLTVYNVLQRSINGANSTSYVPVWNISNFSGRSPRFTVTISYVISPLNLSYNIKPHPYPATLFILNTSDAEGWWITGYTGSSLALALKQIFTVRQYFAQVVTINNTAQMNQLLSFGSLQSKGRVYSAQNSIIINVFGESVPISIDAVNKYKNDFTKYDYSLGQNVSVYNITWVSVVGWPFYEVSNINQNAISVFNSTNCPAGDPYYGVIGICGIGSPGLQNFLEGLNGVSCSAPKPGAQNTTPIPSNIQLIENYYGIYVNPYQTASRAMNQTQMQSCGLQPYLEIVSHYSCGNTVCYPAEVYKTAKGGYFVDIGLVRIPDIRVTALALFALFHPPVIPTTNYLATGYTRLVILKLGEI
ncbi:hypothetical protein B9Q02_09640 [Candidatus Marsarchaeota G1 archaeon BE_D]|jgi:hypothetical protein|uniref:Uncharacterized protein n=2 Tax=Candidatus Marsarchaeota TaxID=1978152 RepID=A0A2R6BUD4_9ARCH|nr:MAG: hypothetical protein B9Q02_09640 [Candidatus Marsarchaeota G1 archaeon BE_D]PSO02165.1 MAG: hypothetical protein B9Q10_01610 [Candidatus Marsarchaeota G2 archaeon ECH_B_SAG-E12]PSO02169.1 MAG: hypothetical protein B9Q10_01630 [Candidatus Marsarchaeota G2 archaeon ECH_B_SAG-E12]